MFFSREASERGRLQSNFSNRNRNSKNNNFTIHKAKTNEVQLIEGMWRISLYLNLINMNCNLPQIICQVSQNKLSKILSGTFTCLLDLDSNINLKRSDSVPPRILIFHPKSHPEAQSQRLKVLIHFASVNYAYVLGQNFRLFQITILWLSNYQKTAYLYAFWCTYP